MELFRIIKRDARSAMRLFAGRTIGAITVGILVYFAINLTQSVLMFIFSGAQSITEDFYSFAKTNPQIFWVVFACSVLYAFIIPALNIGQKKLYLAFANGEDESIAVIFDMFASFKKFFGSFVFASMLFVRHTISFAAALLPGIGLIWFAQVYMPANTPMLEILKIAACCVAIGLIILCSALAIIFVQRWHLAPFYRASGESVHRSFNLSVKASKGLCTQITAFKFSFIGWALLSFFVFPLIWSAPYYALSTGIYSKYLMERYKRSLAQVPESIE